MNSPKNKEHSDLFNKIRTEYIQTEITQKELCEKYNVSKGTMDSWSVKYEFIKERASFQEKRFNKAVNRLATSHAKTLVKLTEVIDEQVTRILKAQGEDVNKVFDPNRMKEVLNAFGLLSKEHRLNNDQPTDNSNMTIKVEFGGGVPLISENHIINKKPDVEVSSESVDEPTIESSAVEEESVEVIVEGQGEDDFTFGGL